MFKELWHIAYNYVLAILLYSKHTAPFMLTKTTENFSKTLQGYEYNYRNGYYDYKNYIINLQTTFLLQ